MNRLLLVVLFLTNSILHAEAPIVGGYKAYFGQLHNHTNVSDGDGTPADAYLYAKNTAKLDFFGIADHDAAVSSTEWADIKAQANKMNQDGVFTTFWGCEWSGGKYGHVAVIGTDEIPKFSMMSSFSALKNWLSTRTGIAFLNHPGRQDSDGVEFDHFSGTPSDKFVGIELWNQNETFSVYYYNDGYFRNDNNKGFFQEGLDRGWKLGAAGSGDNHSGTWGTSEPRRMAILANNLTRADLMAAMLARRFYSTADKNLGISFKINNQEMGSTVPAGTSTVQVEAVDIDGESFSNVTLYNNKFLAVKTWNPGVPHAIVTGSITTANNEYYYVKVKQADGNEAISSPIWISGTVGTISYNGVKEPKAFNTVTKNRKIISLQGRILDGEHVKSKLPPITIRR